MDGVAPRLPKTLVERELSGIESYDKVFAASWLDSSTFVVGTKDNRLIRWDASTNHRVEIALPPSPKPRSTQAACGIHAIAVNPSRTLLATGGSHPNDTAVFHLPSFEPVALLVSHVDWLFAAAWLTDNRLVTGSRDSTVKLWSVAGDRYLVEDPLVTKNDHSSKVRDVKYDAKVEQMATLSADASCKIWDVHLMEPVKSVKLVHTKELICVAFEGHLAVVGSQGHVSIMDVRCGHFVAHVQSADDGFGVRSLSIRDNIVTCGGGRGRLSFLDLRTHKHLPIKEVPVHRKFHDKRDIYHSTGKGSYVQNELYMDHFDGQRIQHAVYAHDYDVTGTRLLAAGGPLHFGLKGCYVAIW